MHGHARRAGDQQISPPLISPPSPSPVDTVYPGHPGTAAPIPSRHDDLSLPPLSSLSPAPLSLPETAGGGMCDAGRLIRI